MLEASAIKRKIDKKSAPNYLRFCVEIIKFQSRRIPGSRYYYLIVAGLKKNGGIPELPSLIVGLKHVFIVLQNNEFLDQNDCETLDHRR